MDAWLKDLYLKNKIVFWLVFVLVLPAIILFLFRDLVLKVIVNKANEELSEAKQTDATIKEKERMAKDQAEESKTNADSIEKKIKTIKEDEDWNKKRGEVSELQVLAIIFFLGIFYLVLRFFL